MRRTKIDLTNNSPVFDDTPLNPDEPYDLWNDECEEGWIEIDPDDDLKPKSDDEEVS